MHSPAVSLTTAAFAAPPQFLDTPDQALLVTVLFSDVLPGAGGTFIAADSAKHVARWFSEHPEGSHGLPGASHTHARARTLSHTHTHSLARALTHSHYGVSVRRGDQAHYRSLR